MTRLGPLRSGLLILAALSAGCGVTVQPLMPSPLIYTGTPLGPLDHIPEHERWIPRRVFYATSRARLSSPKHIDYGNAVAEQVSVGMALVGFGGNDMTWAALAQASTSDVREVDVNLSIAGIMEKGRFDPAWPLERSAAPERAGFWLESLRDVIDDARDKDVLIYVHGAKVDFYNACVFAAQLDHFMGRDLTSLAFSWPTHQNILAYMSGKDVERAYDSADALAALVTLVADHTHAERIHVLSWSAGARVALTALASLRERQPEADVDELRARFRLGVVYFAAGDDPLDEFLRHAPAIHDLADQLVVTQTDDDDALRAGELLMGGGQRIGEQSSELSPELGARLAELERLELVNVSLGARERGFDITGHRYWFDHPWASSDVLLSIRERLTPPERGLEPGSSPRLWFMPRDYPERVRELMQAFAPEFDPVAPE